MNKFTSTTIVLLCILSISCEKEQLSREKGQLISDEITFNISGHILTDYFVTAIDFDSKGNAWIGTFKQGLIKYNGVSATIFNSKNSILPDNLVIWDLRVDHDDNIWLGTKGLIKFDGKSFQRFNTSNSPLLEDIVWAIDIDKNNVVWLSSCRFREGGLMSFDDINWKSYTPENSPLPGNSIQDIVIDNENNVCLAISESVNGACLAKIRNGKWTIFSDSDLGFQPYYFGDIAVGKNNVIVVSIDYMLSSLWDITRPNIIQFDGEKCTINNPVDKHGNSLGYVGVMNTDSKGNIWASISAGDAKIAVYNGQKWYYDDNPDCPIESVFAIESDALNRIWIGTGNGIYIFEQN